MKIIKIFYIFFLIFINTSAHCTSEDFNSWKIKFKKLALKDGISESTFNIVMKNAKFLPKVIEYDRFQPEFYEDTKTYIKKRTSINKVKNGINLYVNNPKLIDLVEKEFQVEKELLLALMGIETNFGTYVGKMDIISSLSTLSYDKRRSEFFTKELLTILKLIDNGVIDYKKLYGSWAGAFGYFQFMPSTIKVYAIDYNSNNVLELKNLEDSFASAANYINKIGWNRNEPCFYKIELNENIPLKYLNTSARKIHNKKKLKYFKKFIKNFNDLNLNNNTVVAIITPDKDIVPDSNTLNPAYLIFNNYELILQWNRSLRFALAVCTLKDKLNNEL